MAVRSTTGMPFVGYVSLTNGTPAGSIPIYVNAGSGAAYTLKATERVYITTIAISSNTTVTLVQVTDQFPTTPKVLFSVYAASTFPPAVATFPPGILLGAVATSPRAVATAVAGSTIEVTITGCIFQQ